MALKGSRNDLVLLSRLVIIERIKLYRENFAIKHTISDTDFTGRYSQNNKRANNWENNKMNRDHRPQEYTEELAVFFSVYSVYSVVNYWKYIWKK